MSQLDKLVELFLKEPPDASFADVAKVLEAFGYLERSSGSGSHRAFVKPGHPPKIVPTIKGRRVKRAYIKMIIENLNLEDWYEERHGA
ncbi:type II toxin-antitoxin system HicA family toxin [Chloroflexota bacterium]